MDHATTKQQDYYAATAESYADAHLTAGDEHYVALEYALGIMDTVNASSVLDVGAGTGRAVDFIRHARPNFRVVGLEPVAALREKAEAGGGTFVGGDGQALPFAAEEFDVVMATGVMHHVQDPRPVVEEMMRVAARAVLISDSNRFGQGNSAGRLLKLALYRAGLWPAFDFIRTQGRGYMESDEDGVFYSYSVYDSLPAAITWGSRAFVIPTNGTSTPTAGALLGATHGLLVATREPADGWAGR